MAIETRVKELVSLSGGNPNGINYVNKFGYNNDVDTLSVPEDMWSAGGAYPFGTFATAQSLEIVSNNAADDEGGTGAITVLVNGLDEDYKDKDAEITLNGVTAVNLPGTWFAINRAYILTTGSGGTNAGILSIQVQTGGTKVSEIPAGRGQTQQCVYRVPDGYNYRISKILSYTDASTGKTASMQLIRVNEDCKTIRVLASGTITEATPWDREYSLGGQTIPGKAWVTVRALEVAQNDTSITGDIDGVLYEV